MQFDLERLKVAVRGKRVAVICHPGSWLPHVGAFADFMLANADVKGFLALEHGLRGELQDGIEFTSYEDQRTGLPVFTIYAGRHTFPNEFLENVDVVVYCVQDISHRAYTYKKALADTMLAASETNTAVVVLDRPTPLGHLGPGGVAAPQYFPLAMPMVVHITLGEMALWLRHCQGLDVDLEVIPLLGWRRSDPWRSTGLPWVPPSPNIPSLDSAYAYTMTWIVQSTNVSEGRGTCKPFEYVGAPFVDSLALTGSLRKSNLPGLAFREVGFLPGFGKYAGQVCFGVHIIIEDYQALNPIRTMATVLQEIARLHPNEFELTEPFDRRMGCGAWTVERLAEMDVDEYLNQGDVDSRAFAATVEDSLLYS